MIRTERLRLRPLSAEDRDAFAAMHADPEVAASLGGFLGAADAAEKLDRYAGYMARNGFGRWAIERSGEFVGYAGVVAAPDDHPLGPHYEIGWCLARHAWGHGYATEAAGAALADMFGRVGVAEVLAYTTPDNLRSQAVIARLPFRRDAGRDFTGRRPALVWVATWNPPAGPEDVAPSAR
jgi:RimJ/RimL family protein N-acetyltransferase